MGCGDHFICTCECHEDPELLHAVPCCVTCPQCGTANVLDPEEPPKDFVLCSEWEQHHIWCNSYMRPRKGCKLCERLFAEYPYESTGDGMKDGEELAKKHFPDAQIRK